FFNHRSVDAHVVEGSYASIERPSPDRVSFIPPLNLIISPGPYGRLDSLYPVVAFTLGLKRNCSSARGGAFTLQSGKQPISSEDSHEYRRIRSSAATLYGG